MPLIGVIEPTHYERKTRRSNELPSWVTVEEVLAQAAAADPRWSPYPYEVLAGIFAEYGDRERVSTTALTGPCPRSKVIAARENYIGELDDMYPAFRGTLIHRTLEYEARPNSLAEWRFFTTLPNGVKISCAPDLVTQNPTTLWDWKWAEKAPRYDYPWPDHRLQVQFNRYIVNHAEGWSDPKGQPADIPVNPRTLQFEHLVVVYLTPDGPKPLEVLETREMLSPNNRLVKRKMPNVWSDEEVLDEMAPRALQYHRAMQSYPEWPDGLEMHWGGKPDWSCPGWPVCKLPRCLAKRWPDNLVWGEE